MIKFAQKWTIRKLLQVALLACSFQASAFTWTSIASDGEGSGALGGHAAAVRNDGTVWVTGDNQVGQLGLGDLVSRSAGWVPVPGISTASKVWTTRNRTFVLLQSGSVVAAGDNTAARLGLDTIANGTVVSSFTPVDGLENVSRIDGYLATTSTGEVLKLTSACGTNNQGFGACDSAQPLLQPLYTDATMSTVLSGVTSASDRWNGTTTDCVVVVKSDGSVWSAGATTVNGQCGGVGTVNASPSFVMAKLNSTSASFSAGAKLVSGHTIVKTDGTVYTVNTSSTKRYWNALTGGTGVTFVSGVAQQNSSLYGAIARLNNNTVKVYGLGTNGRMGTGATGTNSSFALIAVNNVADVALGKTGSLLLLNDGTLWGAGKGGRIGLTSGTDYSFFTQTAKAQTADLPTAPSVVTASAGTTSGAINVNWNDAPSAETYSVYRNTVNAAGGTLVASDVSGLSYQDTPPTNGVFYYSVVATNAAGISPFSMVASGWRNDPPTNARVTIDHGFGAANSSGWVVVDDPNGSSSPEQFSVDVLSQPAAGTVTANGLQLVFTPAANLPESGLGGVNSFTFRLSDKAGNAIERTGYIAQNCPAPSIAYAAITPMSLLEVNQGTAAAWFSYPSCLTGGQFDLVVRNSANEIVQNTSIPVSAAGYNQYQELGSITRLSAGNYTAQISLRATRTTGEILPDLSAANTSVNVSKTADYELLGVVLAEPATVLATKGGLTNQVKLDWSAVPYAEDYEVWRRKTGTETSTLLVANLQALTFSDTSLTNDPASYDYAVRAKRSASVGPFSALVAGFANVMPVASDVTMRHNHGEQFAVVFANVSDGNAADALVIDVVQQPVDGVVTVFGKQLIFTPSASLLNGTMQTGNQFRYRVTDALGESVSATGVIGQYCPPPALNSVLLPSNAIDGELGSAAYANISAVACVGALSASITIRDAVGNAVNQWNVPITARGTSKNVELGNMPAVSAGQYTVAVNLSSITTTGVVANDLSLELVGNSDQKTAAYVVTSLDLLPPANFSVTKGSVTGRVRLSWNSVDGAYSYQLYRSLASGSLGDLLADGLTSNTYDDVYDGVSSYFYTVRAVRGSRFSPYATAQQGWPNVAPIAGPVQIKLQNGESQAVASANIQDANLSDTFSIAILSQPRDGFISTFGKQLIFTPSGVVSGINTFSYQVTDAGGETSISTGTVTEACTEPQLASLNALSTMAYSNGGSVIGTYSASRCLHEPEVSVEVFDGPIRVAGFTKPLTVFGSNKQVTLGDLPGLATRDYDVVGTIRARVSTGDIDQGGQLITNAVSVTKTAVWRVGSVKLPELIASKWTAYQNDDFILIEARNAFSPNCPIGSEAEASGDLTKCFVEWAALPDGVVPQILNGAQRPSASGTPTGSGEQAVTVNVLKYNTDGSRNTVGVVSKIMTITPQADIAFAFEGNLTVKRAVEDLRLTFKQKAGAFCQLTLDATKAALRAQYDATVRSCVVTFNNLSPDFTVEESLSGDRIVLSGRMKEVGDLPLNYEVRRYFKTGDSMVLVSSAGMVTVEEAPLPVLTFSPLRTYADGSLAFANGGALGKMAITDAAAGRINMSVMLDGQITQEFKALKKGDYRFIAAPSGKTLWESVPIKIRVAYTDYPAVYQDYDAVGVASLPSNVMVTAAMPFKVLDTDGPIKLSIAVGRKGGAGLDMSEATVGRWRGRLVQFAGRDVVPMTDWFALPDNKTDLELAPDKEAITFVVEVAPETPDGVETGLKMYTRRLGTQVLKGGPLVGVLAASTKAFPTGAMAYLSLTVDKPTLRAIRSLKWYRSKDGGATWAYWDGVQGPMRVDIVDNEEARYKVQLVNRNSGIASETNVIVLSNSIIGRASPFAEGTLAANAGANLSIDLGSAKPLLIKGAFSNIFMRPPLIAAFQSLTNTGAGLYTWSLNDVRLSGENGGKLTLNIDKPGLYVLKASSYSPTGAYEGAFEFMVRPNQPPMCDLISADAGAFVKVTATCLDPDGKLVGGSWAVNGKRVSVPGSSVFVPKKGSSGRVDLSVVDDSGTEALFSKELSF